MKHFWLCVCALIAPASPLFGQAAEFGVFGGYSGISSEFLGTISGASLGGTGISLADGWKFGFRGALNNGRHFGHEFGYAYNRTQLRYGTVPPVEQGMAIHQGLYNFLAYATPEGSLIRPFATGGGHFNNYTPPGTSAASGGGDLKFGYNYGAGVKVRITPIFAIRFDLRQYVTPKPFDLPDKSGMLRQLELSAGFALIL